MLEEYIKNIDVDERIKMIKAMEFITRHINNENVFDRWLVFGVADGDIEYGDLSVLDTDVEDMEYWLDNSNFSELMQEFLDCMRDARKSGGLYCDSVVSGALAKFEHEVF